MTSNSQTEEFVIVVVFGTFVVGAALLDSPAGLAAYILEKFSSWTNYANIDKPDGGLTEVFTLDDLLTNVMVYWVSGSIITSQRLYKETFSDRNAFDRYVCI